MKTPRYSYGDLVLHQGSLMKVVGFYYKLDRYYYDLLCIQDGEIYVTVDRYMTLRVPSVPVTADTQTTKDYWGAAL